MAESLGDELKQVEVAERPAGREQGLAESLIRVNALDYRLPSNMSVVVERSMKRSFADDSGTYKENGKVIITLNSGEDYVDGINSYLTFEVKLTGGTNTPTPISADFGSGSACNFIENITVTSRSGRELERQESLNSLRRDVDRYQCSQEWVDNFGEVMGYGQSLSANNVRFCIPLNRLVGICNTRKLLPSHLAGGMRFEIKFASFASALTNLGGTANPTGYEISDVSIMLDSYHLADSIRKKLTMMAARQGLEYFYETQDRTTSVITSASSDVIVVRKAVSRALWAIGKTRVTADISSSTADSMASETNDVKDFQWKLGGLYFPNQPLRNLEEQYYYAQYAFDKVKHCFKHNSVSLTNFKATEGLCAVTLERSNVLGLSGIPINNQRNLELRVNYNNSASRTIDVYVSYLKVAKVFVNNVIVKE